LTDEGFYGVLQVDSLNREQMIRFCLSFSCVQNVPDVINLYNVEYNVPRLMKSVEPPMDADEAAIVCLALYKAKSALLNKELIRVIMEIVIKEKDTISSAALSPIARTLKLGSHKNVENEIHEFLECIAGWSITFI
jgi:hypothetical protein